MDMTRQLQSGKCRALSALAAFTAAGMLAACGGGGGGGASDSNSTVPGPTAQQTQKEQAALARAKALNADAMGKITAERAGRHP